MNYRAMTGLSEPFKLLLFPLLCQMEAVLGCTSKSPNPRRYLYLVAAQSGFDTSNDAEIYQLSVPALSVDWNRTNVCTPKRGTLGNGGHNGIFGLVSRSIGFARCIHGSKRYARVDHSA